MAKKLLGVLVDVYNEKAQPLEIEDELDSFYKILDCTCIDIVRRRIGGRFKKAFEIVCDDEGLFREPQKISAIDNLGQPQLVGNIFITGTVDVDGNLTSLTKYDVSYILSKVQKMSTRKFINGYPMLTQCEY
ncbi:MAG: DUF3846 domain-containing protein [bacterium]|nr:DUF3846 domain-containing protein [bacterium]MCM1542642.1 DUF3846 domain-containing protein [Blautia sp.]